MKRALLTLCGFVFALLISNNATAQATKTWIGPNNGVWSDDNNWSPFGKPGLTDTAIFSSSNICDMDMSPVIGGFKAQGVGGNIISTGNTRSLTIGNSSIFSQVFTIDAGATLSVGTGGSFGISFSTLPITAGANSATVAGTLNLGQASSWVVNNAGFTNVTNIDVSGTVNASNTHTGTLLTNSSIATVRFLSGSNLLWARNGGTIPVADYQNGSTINVIGVAGTMASFSAGANYNGLVIWNNTSQTVSGSSAVLLPTLSAAMDSVRVISTGTGSLQMFSNPLGYIIGHLEVQGGVVELGAPTTAISTGTINTDLVVSGGTLYCNSTFAGDAGAAYPITVTVNGNLTQTGGTINLTTRPVILAPGGAAILKVKGNITQSAGLFTSASNYGGQNQLNIGGTSTQNIQMSNLTGIFSFTVANSTSGGSLQSNLLLPYELVLAGGFIQLNNYNISVAAGNIISATNGKVVTNGTGSLLVTGLTALASQDFPVAPSPSTYNPVTLVPSAGAFSPNNYAVRVETGLNPTIAYPLYAVNRTWTVTATTAPGAPVSTTLQYANTDGTSGFTYGDNVDHGVYFGGGWNVDATNIVPVFSSPNYTVTSNVVSLSSGIGLPMVIGNLGSILNSRRTIDLTVQKQNTKAQLNWTFYTTSSIKEVVIERSANGRLFEKLATVPSLITMYTDDNLLAGTNYYRIKVTDAAGKISYSAIAAIINSDAGFDIVSLLPNIVRTEMQLNVTAAKKTKLNVVITDMAGRPAGRQLYSLAAGSNLFDINASALASGMYYLTATTAEGEIKTMRFIKQ